MAIYKTDMVDIDLDGGNIHRSFLNRSIGEGDNLANKFGVRAFRNGVPEPIGSTCAGYFIRPDGNTVAIAGTVSGNEAYVILPQACYAYEGQFSLAIKVSGSNSDTSTLRIVDGVVSNTTTGSVIDPGTILPDINALIAAIEEAVASIPLDYSALSEDVSDLMDINIVEFDIGSVPLSKYNISPSTGKWVYDNAYASWYIQRPSSAKIMRITANATNNSAYALLSALDTHTHGDYPAYATGCERTSITAGTTVDISIPDDCAYIWISKTSSFDATPQFVGMNADLQSLSNLVSFDMASQQKLLAKADLTTGKYIGNAATGDTWTEKLVTNANSLYTAAAIDLSEYISDTLMFEIGINDAHTGVRQFGFCDENNTITWVSLEKSLSYKSHGSVLQATQPIEDKYFFFSCSNKTTLNIYVVSEGAIIKQIYGQAYVSADGSDDNPGTNAFPYATINKALSEGANRIMVKGGIYSQQIDMALSRHTSIEIFNVTPTRKAVFYAPNSLVASSESSVSGYSRVHKATTDKTFAANNIWLFQDGAPDESTEISAEERQPEQRGYRYRCYDTVIKKCSAETLADALTEIENATDYRWYLDSGTLYFSRPQAVSSAAPIRGSFDGTAFFTGMNRKYTIKMTGIDVKYMDVHLVFTAGSEIRDCSCCNVFGATCFDVSRAVGAVFIHCEAARAYTGTNGDGFNGHSLNADDAFAHQTTATFINCWAHDNNDDGISLHERSEFTVIGGLYEYNKNGGGITPANGSHCTCIGVTARKNGEGGFLYMNPASNAEGGVGGQIKCIDCVAESNNIWASVTSAGYKINSAGNKGVMINCKALNEDNGYYVSDEAGEMELTDCGARNCTNVIGGQTTNFTIKNTTLVT